MLREKRIEEIHRMIIENGSMQVTDLSHRFGISKETIRKDLDYLENMRVIRRSFGGAIAVDGPDFKKETDIDPSFHSRNILHKDEKAAIAKFAVSLIQPNDTIIIDSSTTTLQMIQFLPQDYDLLVITNSFAVIAELMKKRGITAVATGGELRKKSTSFLGKVALMALDQFNINKVFLSGKAVTPNIGLMDPAENEVEIKRKFLAVSREAYLLADSSKFGKIGPITDCEINAFNAIISDDSLDDDITDNIEKMGVRVFRVPLLTAEQSS